MSQRDIEYTLNRWLVDSKDADDLPYPIHFNWEQIRHGAKPPYYSVAHFLVSLNGDWQANRSGVSYRGQRYRGIMEVSVWANRDSNNEWNYQIKLMSSAFTDIVVRDLQIPMREAPTEPDPDQHMGPVITDGRAAMIRFGSVTSQESTIDKDIPNIMRRRMLLDYDTELMIQSA